MANKGWVKYHRQILDNKLIQDHNCFILFSGLLLLVDKDTGEYDAGRYQLGLIFKMNPNTAYKALKRLEKKWKTVTLISNNQYTRIKVLKWHDYQQVGNTIGNNAVTTGEQPDTTKQELRIENEEKNIHIIFDYWISKNIVKHKEFSDDMKKAAIKVLSVFSLEEIKTSINNYSIVLKSDGYFKHKWTIEEFLIGSGKDRIPFAHIKKFSDESKPLDNFKGEPKQKVRDDIERYT